MRDGPRSERVLARGRIKVDARRAVAKLREHLLVDLHLYAQELARAAHACGARVLRVRYDADDVVLAWDGVPVPASDLATLFDHLLGGAAGETASLRSLALGANAALGLSPRWVDLYTRPGPGRAHRVRWTPSLIADPDGDRPEAKLVEAPEGMPARGTAVHVRRSAGLETALRAVGRGVPREIALLVAAIAELPFGVEPVACALPATERTPALVRAVMTIPGTRRAWLDIVEPRDGVTPTLEVLERGVELVRYRFAPAGFPHQPHCGVELPVRVVVDADELPTNASRSALREDAGLFEAVQRAAAPALRDALATLVAAVRGSRPAGATIDEAAAELVGRDAARLEDALGAVVCVVAGAAETGASLASEVQALLDEPLLRDAAGRPLAARAVLERARKSKVHYWRGRAPVSEQLAPWLSDVVWARGRTVERLLDDARIVDANDLVEEAKAGAERRLAHLDRPATGPVLPTAGRYAAREAFEQTAGAFQGLRGEIGLLHDASQGARLRLFVEERELDTLALAPTTCPLPLDVALAWDGHVAPRFRYDGVARDGRLTQAAWFVTRMGLLLANTQLAALATAAEVDARWLRWLARMAVGTYVSAARGLELASGGDAPLSQYRALWAAAAWPLSDGRFASLADLAKEAARVTAIAVVPENTRGKAVDGRPVVAVDGRTQSWLAEALGVPAIAYTMGLGKQGVVSVADVALMAAGRPRSVPSLLLDEPRRRVAAVPSATAQVVWLHAGVRLCVAQTPLSLGPATLAIEDDTIVPTEGWDGVRWPEIYELYPLERALLERVLCAAEEAARDGAPGVDPADRSYLVASLLALRRAPIDAGGAALLGRLEELALVPIADEDGARRLVSMSAVDAAHPPPGPVPLLSQLPGFETLTWRPVVARDAVEREALRRAFGERLRSADHELGARLVMAKDDRQRRALLAGAQVDPMRVDTLADAGDPVVALDFGVGGERISVACALPRAGEAPIPIATVEVLWQRRLVSREPLRELAIPVVARVGFEQPLHIEGWAALASAGRPLVARHVRDVAGRLAHELVVAASQPGQAARLFGDPRVLALVTALLAPPGHDALATALRSSALRWPTVQGGDAPLVELRAEGNALCVGRRRFTSWHPGAGVRSELDRPVAFVPEGPLRAPLEALLGALSLTVRDVTPQLDRLQARRSAGGPVATPRLSGEAPHPDLRALLADVGVTAAVGELELVPVKPEITLVGLDGVASVVPADIPVPVRAVAHIEGDSGARDVREHVVTQIAAGAVRKLRELGASLDGRPDFLRAQLRGLTCRALARGDEPPVRTSLAVFPDIAGGWHTLADLRSADSTPFTTDGPPYPRSVAPALILTRAEADALAPTVPMADVTMQLRAVLEGERRRSASPLERVALDAATRARAAVLCTVDEPGLRGEVALLVPGAAAARGIHVHVTARPVCVVPDGDGWPLVAAVEVDLPTTAAFDGLANAKDADKLVLVLRDLVARELGRQKQAPADALASRVLAPASVVSKGTLDFFGTVWLAPLWLAEPRVSICDRGGEASRVLALVPQPKYFDGVVPLAGKLFVRIVGSDDAPTEAQRGRLARMLLEPLTAMVVEAAASHRADRTVLAHVLYQRLLGRPVGKPPAVAVVGGEAVAKGTASPSVPIHRILGELDRAGVVWFTRRDGVAEGSFPQEAPPFVLHHDGGALFDVLATRALPGRVRELGGTEPLAPPPEADVEPVDDPVAGLPDASGEVDGAAGDGPSSVLAPWLVGLRRRIVTLFSGADDEPEPPPALALRQAVERLALTGDPAGVVEIATRGRAVRYERRKRRIVVNRNDPAVRDVVDAFARGDAPSPAAQALVVAAAVAEINRALEAVTDAEELRALAALLEGLPRRPV